MPDVQLLGAAVLLQGQALLDAAYLIAHELENRRCRGMEIAPRHRDLFATLRTANDLRKRQRDDAPVADPRELDHGSNEIDTVTAARLLGWPVRKVQRNASDLDGRMPHGRWIFDRRTVELYAAGIAA